MINISAILVAAGKGKRLGEKIPKAFVKLNGKPLFLYSLKVLAQHTAVSEIVVVVSREMKRVAEKIVSTAKIKKQVKIVLGGKERWESVQNGVVATADKTEWVLIHDAARPFVTKQVIDSAIAKTKKFKAVIIATPVDDTIRKFVGDRAAGTIDRSTLVRVGTPQMFNKKALGAAFGLAAKMKTMLTDEAMLMEEAGIPVGIAWGDPGNFKITTPADLAIAGAIILKNLSKS
jgi:2-C-methyl-D-erythritol 4-phosphate cytidylyltransferase